MYKIGEIPDKLYIQDQIKLKYVLCKRWEKVKTYFMNNTGKSKLALLKKYVKAICVS